MSRSPVTGDLRTDHQDLSPAVISDGRLSIDLGGTIVEITSAARDWLSETRERYGAFVCSGRDAEISVIHTNDEGAMTARTGYLSVVGSNGRSAEVAAAQGTDILDGVIRTLLPRVIAPDLMVHGALLSDGERGFLCCGVSGSGKSTMAALFPEAALCDELVRLHVGPEGVEARSLPFWTARPASVALGGIFMIEHGADHRRTRLSYSDAVKALRRHIYWPVEHLDLMHQSFEAMTDICRDTPAFRLAFRPDVSVWATMTEGL